MKPDGGCSARLTQPEAWASIKNDEMIRWCHRCKRFRKRTCEIAYEEVSAIRKMMFRKMRDEGRWMNGRRSK